MKITKFGHCCFLIEDNGVRILTDPGKFSDKQNELKNIDAIVISHEHDDHIHVGSLDEIIENNPEATIITNTGVKSLLKESKHLDKIKVVEDGANIDVKGLLVEAFGNEHIAVYPNIKMPQCTGYFFNNKFFLPGDNFNNPGKSIDVLGLPVSGPWLKISESVDYALNIRPRIAIPVHDANMITPGGEYILPRIVLEPQGIKFMPLELNKEYDL
jgi:L-ascorbate metabolism protein UlaG (beta-lactamase superfamily)